MKEKTDIELRSEAMQEVLKRPPSWIVRWGSLVLFLVILMLLIFSWFFRYPDLIKAPVVVSSSNPPEVLVSRVDGRIVLWNKKDKTLVKKNDIVAILESSANARDVLSLERKLTAFDLDSVLEKKILLKSSLQLGGVQVSYASFCKQYNDYWFFVENSLFMKRSESLKEEIGSYKDYINSVEKQISILHMELLLVEQSFIRDSVLFHAGVISKDAYEMSKGELLSSQLVLEKQKSEVAKTKATIYSLENSLSQYQEYFAKEKQSYRQELEKAFNVLNGDLKNWKLNYQLVSTVNGVLNYSGFWAENQYVEKGRVVAIVVPVSPKSIEGKAFIPILGSGKVKVGQTVYVKLNNYPHMQYGVLVGRVKGKSEVPANDVYVVEIELDKGLVTNYGIKLEMGQEISGTVEIVTDDLRLIQRFFDPIKAIMKKNILRP